MDDFRNSRTTNLQLSDLTNHVIEFSKDQHGSRFIQQKLERATKADLELIFQEIKPNSYWLVFLSFFRKDSSSCLTGVFFSFIFIF